KLSQKSAEVTELNSKNKKITKAPTKKSAKKTVKKPAKKTVKKPAKKSIKKPTKKPAKKIPKKHKTKKIKILKKSLQATKLSWTIQTKNKNNRTPYKFKTLDMAQQEKSTLTTQNWQYYMLIPIPILLAIIIKLRNL
ncbi:hypothetical protein HZC20_02500, partial [Candidatus Peregrinibacteria bacterium]|nr:hypothetical protein [Candidatus Peregrinibacteria bacterium]